MTEPKTDEPLCVVTITKTANTIEHRSIVFNDADTARGVADWLHSNNVANTRMSIRAYEMLIAARTEREQQVERVTGKQPDKSDLFGDKSTQVAWCPFCRKNHPGGAVCMGHYP